MVFHLHIGILIESFLMFFMFSPLNFQPNEKLSGLEMNLHEWETKSQKWPKWTAKGKA
jgi:hypothetical protein